jgi:hypothetical protein
MNVPAGTVPSPTPEPTPAPSPTPTPTPEPTPTPSPTPGEGDPPKPLIEGEAKPEPAAEFTPLTAEDITFPEGFEVQETFRDEFLTVVNNQELSPKDRAQALTDLYTKAATAASEASSQAFADLQKTWQDEVKADPTIGGDKLTPTLAAVNKLVGEYGTPELLEVFAATGAGNNVHVIKFLNTVAGHLTEGKPVTAAAPVNQEQDRAARMFPSMKG